MNATKAELTKEFKRAKSLGWIAHFEEAADTISGAHFDAADLMGIGSRETNLDPQWLRKLGDRGHAGGLMQADKRFFPAFISSGEWKDARKGILYGAQILMQGWKDVQSGVGQKRTVKSSKSGKVYTFTGKQPNEEEAQQITIAGYNSGRWPQYAFARGEDMDAYTTGHDYSSDVIDRATIFRSLLEADSTLPATTAINDGNPIPPQPSNSVDQSDPNSTDTANTASADTAPDLSGNGGDAPPITQTAETIVNTGDIPAPAVPTEEVTLVAPPSTGAVAASTKMTIAGIAVPSCLVAVFKTISNLVTDGYIDAKDIGNTVLSFITNNTKYVLALVGLVIVLVIIKRVTMRITLWLSMLTHAIPSWNSITVVPSEPQAVKKWWQLWR